MGGDVNVSFMYCFVLVGQLDMLMIIKNVTFSFLQFILLQICQK